MTGYIFMTTEALYELMSIMNNKGKNDGSKRVFPCSTVGMLESSMEWREADIDDISTYRDPPSEQNDGKVCSTLGGYVACEPDSLTFRNSLASGGVTYDAGSSIAFVWSILK